MRISVHIPFYLKNNKEKKRLKNFNKICKSYLNLSPKTEVFAHCNKKLKSKNKKIKFIFHNFKKNHPFKLTWFCRELMEKQKDDYKNEILHGDIHTANQNMAGLETRDQAKTFIYALVYGAGDAKIGSIVGGNKDSGKKLKETFFTNLPTLRSLRERVCRAASRGYLKGIDGRKIYVRSEHAALNTLLQGGGAIVMKKALALLDYKFKLVALIHLSQSFVLHQSM